MNCNIYNMNGGRPHIYMWLNRLLTCILT